MYRYKIIPMAYFTKPSGVGMRGIPFPYLGDGFMLIIVDGSQPCSSWQDSKTKSKNFDNSIIIL